MAGILDPGDHRIVSRLLNDVNDAGPGNIAAYTGISGSILQSYWGMVGKRLVCTAAMAKTLSDTAVGTLFEGIYQYVQTKSASITAPARGGLCFWQDFENYIVTPDARVTDPVLGGPNYGLFAGVYLSAPTKGNYCFIQLAGKASVLFKSPTTKTPAAMSDEVVVDAVTPSNVADVLLDATTLTYSMLRIQLGIAINTPVQNAISLVDLWHLRQVLGGLGGF